MNRLVIIGNGFDLAHGLKTSYKDFICWFLEGYFDEIYRNGNIGVTDRTGLLKITMHCSYNTITGDRIIYGIDDYREYLKENDREPWKFLEKLHNTVEGVSVEKSILLKKILGDLEEKNWTDIESDYYELLKKNADDISSCQELNVQLDCLRFWLAEYLKTQTTTKKIQGFLDAVNEDIDEEDVAISERQKMNRMIEKVDETLFLNFNYTNTIHNYKPIPQAMYRFHFNPIHGSLAKPNEMIFGYGDEMDKDFKDLENRNENALLDNSKSIKYLETSHYRDLLSFIEGGPFQVYIMGHSCGNSDRTLLNTIFEHQNCISIKPFCYINEKGEDNYSELTRNIYRNFTDKKLFRDRVVNKERCTTLDGRKLNCQTQAETH